MTVLITGAAGFIGRGLAASFSSDDQVILADINHIPDDLPHARMQVDLTDWNAVAMLPDADVVYHLCAYNNTAHFYSKPFSVAHNTLSPTVNLLRRYPRSKFIYSSSSEIYAGAVNLGICPVPTPEVDVALLDGITNPRWSYASSKIMGEILVHAAHRELGTPYLIIRYHNVYGPNQRAHFIPEYATKLLLGSDELMGSEQTRAFLYIDDAVDLTRRLSAAAVNDTFNIGCDVETSIETAAAIIREVLDVHREPTRIPALPGSVPRRLPDIQKLRGVIGAIDFIDLRQGIAETIAAIR